MTLHRNVVNIHTRADETLDPLLTNSHPRSVELKGCPRSAKRIMTLSMWSMIFKLSVYNKPREKCTFTNEQTDVIIMDFAKAFDKVPHRWLLYKLDHYGIRGSTHKWISSWLSERSQKVKLDGQASDPGPVLSGVPQGSVLGPVLFLIFINDLPDNIRSSVLLFADDCVLYRNIKSPIDC